MKGQFSSYLCLVLRNTVRKLLFTVVASLQSLWGAHVARHVEYVYKSGRDGSEW